MFILVVKAGHGFIQTSLLVSVTSLIIVFDLLNNQLSEFGVVILVVVAVVEVGVEVEVIVVVVEFTIVQLLRMFDGALTMLIAPL